MNKPYTFLALILSLILISGNICSQTYFEKVYSNPPYDQEGQDVLPTADGGYLIAGYTNTSILNDADVLVIKSDAAGNEIWRKTYGGTKPDFPYHMLATTDGNYFLVGYSQSYGGGDYDILLMKIDPAGTVLWTQTYGGWGNDIGRDVITTSDGNYVIVGSSNSPGLADQNANLIKIDPSGNVLWSKFYGGTANDYGNSVRQTSDGGYIMLGKTFSYGVGNGDAYLVKLNSNGDTTWTKTFGGPQNDEGEYITIAPDGGYAFLVRDSSSAGKDIDVRFIKTDASGNVVWNKVYGGNKKDTPKMVQTTSDGGYIIGAISRSFGWMNPDMWILKCNSLGDTTWARHYGGTQNEHCYVVREMTDGSYIAIGKTGSYGPNLSAYFLKLNSQGTLTVGLEEQNKNPLTISVYPNPSTGIFNIDLTEIGPANIHINDLLGKEIYTKSINKTGLESIQLNSKPGIYFMTLKTGKGEVTKKLIVN
ncbi:MAG: T9SS type A sorting domain-containing protein [Bacteroidetes bacterium]|nr:T9SS type A sorting domain-containing protein [Bacteroidota bacterium]